MNMMESLLKEIKETSGVDKKTTYACQSCTYTYESPEPLEACPKCKKEVYQWPGETVVEAMNKAKRAARLSSGQPVEPTTTEPTTTEPAKTEPAKDAIKSEREQLMAILDSRGINYSKRLGNKKLKELVDNADSKPETNTEPVQTTEKPAQPNTEEPTITVKVEKAPEPAKTEVVQKANEPVEDEPEQKSSDEKAEERFAKIQAFIKKHKLTEHTPTPIGTAKVQTYGITIWTNGRPAYRFMEPFETPESFAKVYDALRAEQPAAMVDVIRCSDMSDDELSELVFKGSIIASLVAPGGGLQSVEKHSKVKIGALSTPKGYIRFVVLDQI